MILDASEAKKRIGQVFPFEQSEKLPDLDYGGREIVLERPLHVAGEFFFNGKEFQVQGDADTVLASVCARCGTEFPEPYSFHFEERFSRDGSDEDDEDPVYACEGDMLPLERAVMDNFYLNLPLISVCKPDCKGLCPVCGANRNETECGCLQTETDHPFSVLKDLNIKE